MLIDRIAKGARQSFATKFNPAMGAVVIQGLRSPAWSPTNYTALANEGYVQNVDVHACVSLIATAFAGAPWIFQTKKGSSKPKLVESGPIIDLWNRPNPLQGTGSFLENTAGFQELAGNSYIFRFCLKSGPPRELYSLRPDRMKIVLSGNPMDPIAKYEYRALKVIDFLPDRFGHVISHWANFHPIDDFYGLSAIQVAARNIDQSNAAAAWNTSLFQNRCQPSGALVVESGQTLTDDQFNRAKDQIKMQIQGTANAGMPMLLEGGLKWQQMSLSPADADWLNSDERSTEKICRAHGVPPELIGARTKGGLNDGNYKEARRQFWMEKMLPCMDRFCDVQNNSWVKLFGDEYELNYDRDKIEAIQEDRETVYNRTLGAVKSSVMQVNEAREELGLPPMPGWDVLLVPTGVTIMEEPGVSVGLPEPQPGGLTVPAENAPAPSARPPKQIAAPPPKKKEEKSDTLDEVAEAMLSGAGMR